MRYLSAQFLGLLETGAWLKHAKHANECTAYLESQLVQIPELSIMFPRQANAVFVEMPVPLIQALHEQGWHFYTFIGVGGARLMCSWNTTYKRIDEFINAVKQTLLDLKPSTLAQKTA